ncbi:MAG: NAD-dependent epimerase/dehydratase family protein [Deltaproteobacteria bacterium]|nr:NAD-dependent epimerase/dehydratase family protein [Deltaproteobacteria bacterium]
MNSFLITGTGSGLGAYLYKNLGGISFNRETPLEDIKDEKVDVIIHCAFPTQKKIDFENAYQYLKDTFFLTQALTQLKYKKFIYISTVDVYPQNGSLHKETESIDVTALTTLYSTTKYFCEKIVSEEAPSCLILRCSVLLGLEARVNSLVKIIKEENPSLTLSKESTFNYILYSDVLHFIEKALERDLSGLYNVVSNDDVTLGEIARLFHKKPSFGSFTYKGGGVNNHKASQVLPSLNRSSKEVIAQFVNTVENQ